MPRQENTKSLKHLIRDLRGLKLDGLTFSEHGEIEDIPHNREAKKTIIITLQDQVRRAAIVGMQPGMNNDDHRKLQDVIQQLAVDLGVQKAVYTQEALKEQLTQYAKNNDGDIKKQKIFARKLIKTYMRAGLDPKEIDVGELTKDMDLESKHLKQIEHDVLVQKKSMARRLSGAVNKVNALKHYLEDHPNTTKEEMSDAITESGAFPWTKYKLNKRVEAIYDTYAIRPAERPNNPNHEKPDNMDSRVVHAVSVVAETKLEPTDLGFFKDVAGMFSGFAFKSRKKAAQFSSNKLIEEFRREFKENRHTDGEEETLAPEVHEDSLAEEAAVTTLRYEEQAQGIKVGPDNKSEITERGGEEKEPLTTDTGQKIAGGLSEADRQEALEIGTTIKASMKGGVASVEDGKPTHAGHGPGVIENAQGLAHG